MPRVTVGVMGPGESARPSSLALATELGRAVAQRGWVVLTGGRAVGVMEAASRAAQAAGGLTVGILPDRDRARASAWLDGAIATDLGNARNNLNILSSDVVVACGTGLGTTSEIALALKAGKLTLLLDQSPQARVFFQSIGGDIAPQGLRHRCWVLETVAEAIEKISAYVEQNRLERIF